MDKFQLDLTELGENDRAGYGFQALIAEIGRVLNYDVEESGTGPDGGRDLFFEIPYQGLYSKREKKNGWFRAKILRNQDVRFDAQISLVDSMMPQDRTVMVTYLRVQQQQLMTL